MSKFGGWNAQFSTNYPQKIASAVSAFINEPRLGCEYKDIAYLGSQVVNGTKHAVLMEQTIVVGRDVKNAVIVYFYEAPGSMDVALAGIETLVESGGELGGTKVDMSVEIPNDAKVAFEAAMVGFLGSTIVPVVYIGSKVVKGVEYKMIAEVTPVIPDAKTELALITVNGLEKTMQFEKVFPEPAKAEITYSLKNGVKVPDITLGTPLGEWP